MRILQALAAALSICIASQQQAIAAPSDNLLSYWTLDGNTTDSAAGGSFNDNGSWVGSTSYLTAPFGQGANFNGSSYISIPTSGDLEHAGSSLSISVWFKVDSWTKSWQCLLSKGEGSNYRIARRGGDSQELAYAGGTGDISGGAVNDSQWHHAVAVSDNGNNMFLYIDGVQAALGGAPSLADSGLPLYLGENSGSTGRQWDGGMDDLGIFDVPLSSFQVAAIHELGTDTNYLYPLSKVIDIFDAHAAQASIVIDGTTWQYAATDPGGASGFILLAGNGSGVVSSPGPTLTSFSASPIFIDTGESSTLSWQIDPPFTSVTIDKSVGNVTASTNGSGAGSVGVSPTATTVYTLTASNVDGSTTATTTVYFGIDPTAPRINEFVARNGAGGLVDEIGSTEDWIELYAPGLADLSTYYLTDDAAILNKWAFPAMSMPADSYLIIFASDKNLTGNPAFLHTNFKLSGGGEYLALTRDDGSGGFDVVTEFSPGYPPQEETFSYGLSSDQVTLGFFNTPTPNATNGVAFQGFVADTQFSVGRGFYDTAQSVAITTLTPGATIRYTTDGSTPTTSNGTVYSAPLSISSTTIVRAFAYKTDFEPTNVDTQTYFFLEDIRTQYANGVPPSGWPASSSNGQTYNYGMDPDITNNYTSQQMKDALSAIPSISVVTDLPNLVSASTGIYSNPGGHGSGWERPASVEMINPDASAGFQVEAGIRIRGGFSRSKGNPKHALRLFFRAEYGDSKLAFPLFGNEGADEFDKVDLRTSQNYSWAFQNDGNNTFLREVLGRDLQGKLGQPYTRSHYYHLYLNGVYWGLYMTQERAEANYGATYFKGSKDEFDTIKSAGSSGGYNTEATDGSFVQGSSANPGSDWADFWYQARDHNTSPSHAKYMELQGLNPDGTRNIVYPVLLEVDNLIDYTLIIGYTGNYDAPLSDFVGASNNWYSLRNRVRDDRGVAFFVHDGEHSLGAGGKWNGANDRINTSNGAGSRGNYSKSNPAFMHFDLASGSEEYRVRFADRAHKALFNGGVLDTASVLATMEERRTIVEDVIIAEAARWGDSKRSTPFDKPNWISAVNSLIGTINGRRIAFIGHLQTADLYPSLGAPVYNQHGGPVSNGFGVTMTADSAGPIYYILDGGDPREIGGTLNPSATLLAGAVPINAPTVLNARRYNSGTGEWSAMNSAFFTTGVLASSANIVISEVNYHPYDASAAELADLAVTDEEDFEFVEI
ncbi:MAG: hypothetical protein ACI8XO_004056, partial [Verrucomicrobiales bacterium]